MADITMCATNDCPIRHDCYRQMATPSEYRQSYAFFKWELALSGDFACANFMQVYDKQVGESDE